METLNIALKVLDLDEVRDKIADLLSANRALEKEVAELHTLVTLIRQHGRPWQTPNESMIGEKFVMWTNHGTLLIGPFTKDFLKTGFVVAVQPYPSSPEKQRKAWEVLL